MATAILGLKNDHEDQSTITDAWLNAVADELEGGVTRFSELFGAGVLGATALNLTIVSGQIALEISAGWAIVGDAGERRLVRIPETVIIDTAQSLAASSTRYVFLLREPTDPDDLATYFTANTSGTPPADSILIGSAVFNGTEATSVNNWPSGRVNLDTVGVAWYTPSTFSFAVNCPPGEDRIVDVNFASQGSFAGEYLVRATHDQDDDKTIVWDCKHGRSGSRFRLVVQNANNASAGSYGTATQVLVTVRLEGRLWTPNASPSAPTITVSTFAGPQTGTLFTGTANATHGNSVAITSIVPSGVGTLALAPDVLAVGRSLRIRGRGFISETGTPTFRLRLMLNADTVLDSGTVVLPAALSNSEFSFDLLLTCRSVGAFGSVFAQGFFYTGSTRWPIVTTAVVANINTTVAITPDVTAEWGTAHASNTLAVTNFTVEVLP